MKLKPFLSILISGVIFIIFVLMPSSWFTGLVTNKTLANNRLASTDQVLKGTLIQNKLFKSNDYYPIYGSSELNKEDPFNPGIALNGRKGTKPAYLLGTGGSTDLINAVELAAQYDQLKGKKISLIISPQWFTDHGLTNKNYDGRMSANQIDQLFKQSKMPAELKQRYAKRLLQFKHAKNKAFLKQLAKHPDQDHGNYISQFKGEQIKKIEAIKLYFGFDKSPLSHVEPVTSPNASWNEMNRKATKIAIDHSKSNKYGIKDEYWKLIKENRRKVRRDWEFNINSPEFNDLKLLVDTMREAGADVQYVSIPANGKWYDHIGIPHERRQPVYNKIRETVINNGGQLYDMTDKEYAKHYITDAVHIGWKGWVDMDRQIDKHMRAPYKAPHKPHHDDQDHQ